MLDLVKSKGIRYLKNVKCDIKWKTATLTQERPLNIRERKNVECEVGMYSIQSCIVQKKVFETRSKIGPVCFKDFKPGGAINSQT